MRGLRRIYYEGPLDGVIELPEDDSRRLKTVLRASDGDTVEILTEEYLARGTISGVGKRSVFVRVDEKRAAIKPDYVFTVFQCLTKREYMDGIIEKYAELGATKIVPVISARSVGEVKPSSLRRFRIIARDAATGGEAEFVPEITVPLKLRDVKAERGENFLFHERNGERKIPSVKGRSVSMIIGPEGGFEEEETRLLEERGFRSFTPLNRILKAETAAVLFAGTLRMALE